MATVRAASPASLRPKFIVAMSTSDVPSVRVPSFRPDRFIDREMSALKVRRENS